MWDPGPNLVIRKSCILKTSTANIFKLKNFNCDFHGSRVYECIFNSFVLLQLGNLLDESEYQKKIVPCVVKLFSCNDRATRSKLLQQMEHYIGLLH